MSIAGILSSSLFRSSSQSVHNRMQQFRQDFQKLGQDLQTGNLTGAQADFAAFQKDGPQSSSATQTSNPIAQGLQQLSTDLQSGNLTAAQQDYSNLQQDFQNQAAQRPHHHHHSSGSQDNSAISQLFSQIGQDLQSGDLSSAQQAYTTLQQDLQQYALSNGALNGVASSGVSETA
jgi:outer membrane protein assembly factor BamD (BamD/ComL family)